MGGLLRFVSLLYSTVSDEKFFLCQEDLKAKEPALPPPNLDDERRRLVEVIDDHKLLKIFFV